MRGIGGSAEYLSADMGDAEHVCALAEAVVLATQHICSKKERSCWHYQFFFLAIYSTDR